MTETLFFYGKPSLFLVLFPDCQCSRDGSNLLCDSLTGNCQCKAAATGRHCDSCRQGFFNISQYNNDGCQPCLCRTGHSNTSSCDKISGQCECRSGFFGRDCRQLQLGFATRRPEIILEAENQPWADNISSPLQVSDPPQFTGSGFVLVGPAENSSTGNFEFMIPGSSLPRRPHVFCVSVRYMTQELLSSGSTCSPKSRLVGSFVIPGCRAPPCRFNVSFILTVTFDSELTAPLFIDAVVFRPNLFQLFGAGSPLLDEFNITDGVQSCIDTVVCDVTRTISSEPALAVAASAELFDGATCKYRTSPIIGHTRL